MVASVRESPRSCCPIWGSACGMTLYPMRSSVIALENAPECLHASFSPAGICSGTVASAPCLAARPPDRFERTSIMRAEHSRDFSLCTVPRVLHSAADGWRIFPLRAEPHTWHDGSKREELCHSLFDMCDDASPQYMRFRCRCTKCAWRVRWFRSATHPFCHVARG